MSKHFYSIRLYTAFHFFSIFFTSCNLENSNNNMQLEQSSTRDFDSKNVDSQKRAGKPCVKILAAGVGGLLLGALITGLATGLPLSEQRNNANKPIRFVFESRNRSNAIYYTRFAKLKCTNRWTNSIK